MFKKLAFLGVSAALVGFTALGAASSPAAAEQATEQEPSAQTVVISEVKARTPGTTVQLVELLNPTEEYVDISGYQLVRCSARGVQTVITTLPRGTELKPFDMVGRHLLIAPRVVFGVNPDVIANPNIAPEGGVLLRSPRAEGSEIIDAVGFSPAAGQCVEGEPAEQPAGQFAQEETVQRNEDGTDTNENAFDLSPLAPSPKNQFLL